MDLVEILKRAESKTLEFKRDLSSPDGVLRTVVAFANSAGGTLLLGVEDKSRRVRGVADPLALEERLANLISDRIAPRLVPDIEILPWRRTHVLAVEVHPSPSRPHYLKRRGLHGGTYVRVGSTNRQADAELIDQLGRFARGVAFDEQPMPELDSEAIDFRAASESFAGVRALAGRDLESLRLVTRHQRRKVPTVGGMILFGKDREQYFPDAWIQVGRFGGTNKSNIVDRAEIHRLPVQAVEEAIAVVQKHTLHGARIGSVRRSERWSLPPVAVREAVINAFVHTDYAQRGAPLRLSIFDDRLEVENPGLLPSGLTVEELATRFRVTITTAKVGPPLLDDTDQTILTCLAGGQGWLTSEIAAEIELSTRATRTRLVRLVGRGIVREIGTGPQDPQRRDFGAEAETDE